MPNIRSGLVGKTPKEKVVAKANALVGVVSKQKNVRTKVSIEIIEIAKMEGGVEVLAKAWDKDDVQIGFGEDGTIEIERFKLYMQDEGKNNHLSWLVVPDEAGDIIVEETQRLLDGGTEVVQTKYREDPEEHLLMFLEMVINGLQTQGAENIVPGKRGNTISAFTSASGGDGEVLKGPVASWAGARDAAAGDSSDTTATDNWVFGDFATPDYRCTASFLPFDTSALSTDTISAATLMVRQAGNDGEGNRAMGIVQTSQASTSSLGTGDFDERGGLTGITEGATRVTYDGQNTDRTFTLNASGLTWIDGSGFTKLGFRSGYDLDDTTPVARNYTRIYYADVATAAYRPTLTVTHASAGGIAASRRVVNAT